MTELLGWKEHFMRVGDGFGRWEVRSCEFRILHNPEGGWSPPFGLAMMDNGEILLLGSRRAPGADKETTYFTHSKDLGDTWTPFQSTPYPESQRPMMLADLGGGKLTYTSDRRYFSSDYGHTWPEAIDVQPPSNGSYFGTEGNPVVEFNSDGSLWRIGEIGYNYGPKESEGHHPVDACTPFVRWSYDGGRTWTDEVTPPQWTWTVNEKGKTYTRSISEGSMVRARNGWLVAALRTDMPPRYFDGPNDDSLEGTGISISKDHGQTWSEINTLYDAGRHHAHLLLMPNGDIVMTMVVRDDVRDGVLASYRRGCDAMISKDDGLTWDINRRYILDEYEYLQEPTRKDEQTGRMQPPYWVDGNCGHLYSCLLPDGRILTAYANYLTKGACLMRWIP